MQILCALSLGLLWDPTRAGTKEEDLQDFPDSSFPRNRVPASIDYASLLSLSLSPIYLHRSLLLLLFLVFSV